MAGIGEAGRSRGGIERQKTQRSPLTFINPYPWMSSIEAMVHLALEEHKIPFSWRWFDGQAPDFTQLLTNQGFQPEFTLREYNTVIMVEGGYFGTLPGVLDKVALAQVTLEADGWKVIILWDQDIRTFGAWELLLKAMPNLGTITGPPRPNPYGHPDLMKGIHTHRNRLVSPRETSNKGKRNSDERRTVRRGGHRASDSGRTRIGSKGAVSKYRSR